MGANVLQSAALMSRRNNISKLINHHYNNNNLQSSIRSFSYKFDSPKSSKVSFGVGLGFTAGILIGAFGIHVDGSLKNNGLGISVGRSNEWYQHAAMTKSIMRDNIDSGLLLAQAVLNQTAPEVAAERYLASAANYINIQYLTDPNSIDHDLEGMKKALSNDLKRLVLVKGDDDDEGKVYELLKDDGLDSCVVKGPLNLDQFRGGGSSNPYLSEETITVKRDDVYFVKKSPVECHDLVGEDNHCNGKIGTVTGADSKEGRNFLISFEDVSIGNGRAWVPRQNLRGVVNLPIFREDHLPYPILPCTPVVCQGLVSDHEKHLNDKVGTILSVDYENYTTMVVFEDANIPDTKVHLKNLFLSRELPKKFMSSTPKSKDK